MSFFYFVQHVVFLKISKQQLVQFRFTLNYAIFKV